MDKVISENMADVKKQHKMTCDCGNTHFEYFMIDEVMKCVKCGKKFLW